jgi:hypothetical protein
VRALRRTAERATITLRIIGALGTFTVHSKGRTGMASSGKKKTTMAKMDRENRVRERRAEKKAKKDARKLVGVDDSPNGGPAGSAPLDGEPQTGEPLAGDAVDPA